jgi:putative transposase
MTNYRRAYRAGSTYFFTVNLADRQGTLLVDHINDLREAVRYTRQRHPFAIDAMTVMPDHLHAVWTLPPGDADYSLRWRLIKGFFSRRIAHGEHRRLSRISKVERGIWQRRYWEHLIRDEDDLRRHVDYTHFNPVKHGHVSRVADWPHSTFHREVREGRVSADWGVGVGGDAGFGERG